MASEPAEPTTRQDPVERAAWAMWRADGEPLGVAKRDRYRVLARALAEAGLLADPAQTTGLQARLDAALAELAKYEPSPGCCTACNGVGTVPTGYPCEDCYATGHCHDEAVRCDGMAVDAIERDERQARIDAANLIATRAIDEGLPADEALRMIARTLEGKTARALSGEALRDVEERDDAAGDLP